MQLPDKNTSQFLFRDMIFGTLVYSVVLGFFNDYTTILQTKSYSIIFAVAIVMQVLTYLTLRLKDKVIAHFKQKTHPVSKYAMMLSVWLILFFSKFVFLEVIDFIFGDTVEISGFIGLLAIILVMTIAKQLIDYIYSRLAPEQ